MQMAFNKDGIWAAQIQLTTALYQSGFSRWLGAVRVPLPLSAASAFSLLLSSEDSSASCFGNL